MSYGSNDTFGVFLAHSIQKLWSLIGLPAAIVYGAERKGPMQVELVALTYYT